MHRTPTVLAATALLIAACSPRPAMQPGGDFLQLPPEKALFTALKETRASDAQRLAIFAAFDETQPKLRALAEEGDEAMRQWRDLDRRDPGFVADADRLAARYAEISRERLRLTAAFEGRVAATLDEDQWAAWRAYWNRPMTPPGIQRVGGPIGQRKRE